VTSDASGGGAGRLKPAWQRPWRRHWQEKAVVRTGGGGGTGTESLARTVVHWDARAATSSSCQ
jgi:hypothetical protein